MSRQPATHPDRSLSHDLAAEVISASFFLFERQPAHELVVWRADLPPAPGLECLPRRGYMRIRSSQPPFLTQTEALPSLGRKRSACQQFLFASRKFFIRQHTRIVKLGELLKLGSQV